MTSPLPVDPWNSLEIAKLVVGVLTPLSVAALGLFISRRLKRLDLLLWTNQKLIEKRLTIYDTVAPQLNKLLCFFTWVGYWKDVSPADAIQAKRDLDKTINVYRHLFDDEIYARYQEFIHTLFETYTGTGADALIRSIISGPDGDRRSQCNYTWAPSWAGGLAHPSNAPSSEEIRLRYQALMSALTRSLGTSSRNT